MTSLDFFGSCKIISGLLLVLITALPRERIGQLHTRLHSLLNQPYLPLPTPYREALAMDWDLHVKAKL